MTYTQNQLVTAIKYWTNRLNESQYLDEDESNDALTKQDIHSAIRQLFESSMLFEDEDEQEVENEVMQAFEGMSEEDAQKKLKEFLKKNKDKAKDGLKNIPEQNKPLYSKVWDGLCSVVKKGSKFIFDNAGSIIQGAALLALGWTGYKIWKNPKGARDDWGTFFNKLFGDGRSTEQVRKDTDEENKEIEDLMRRDYKKQEKTQQSINNSKVWTDEQKEKIAAFADAMQEYVERKTEGEIGLQKRLSASAGGIYDVDSSRHVDNSVGLAGQSTKGSVLAAFNSVENGNANPQLKADLEKMLNDYVELDKKVMREVVQERRWDSESPGWYSAIIFSKAKDAALEKLFNGYLNAQAKVMSDNMKAATASRQKARSQSQPQNNSQKK